MTFSATPLPYALDALEPHISRETLEYHHGKHYTGYVKKLNDAVKGTDLAKLDLAEIVRRGPTLDCYNNAAQAWNHEFYFTALSPAGERTPGGELAAAIDAAFGSFEQMCERFRKHAAGLFGSGWTWLVVDAGGELEIVDTGNADNPMTAGKTPLLTCDVWEHAYYIDYRNARAEYLDAYMALVDWNFVAENFAAAKVEAAA